MTNIWRSEEGARAVQQQYVRVLDSWPVPHERLRLPTREGDTFVLAWGAHAAPPLILLQGSGANTAMWLQDASAWAPHFRIYAVDIIGEPGLSVASRPPLVPARYADWFDDVLTGLGLGRVSIMGVSLGGWVALSFATQCPERVERLALLSPSGIGRQRVWSLLKLMPLLLLGARGRRKIMEMVAPQPSGSQPTDWGPLGPLLSLTFKHFRPRRGRIPRFSDGELHRLTMPALLIVGGRDVLLRSEESARRLERHAVQASVRLLPDAGHLISHQTLGILDFLRGHPGPQYQA